MLPGLKVISGLCSVFDSVGISIQSSLCLHTKHKRNTCAACSDACGKHAIDYHDGLTLNTALCTGCGACASACLSGAVSAVNPSDANLRSSVSQHLAHDSKIAFACERYLQSHQSERYRAIAIPCIARLNEATFVHAAMRGATSITIIDECCEECEQSVNRVFCHDLVANTSRLLQVCGKITELTLASAPPDEIPAERQERSGAVTQSRRFFLAALGGRAGRVAAELTTAILPLPVESMPTSSETVHCSRKLPEKWSALREALVAMGHDVPDVPFSSKLWGELSIGPACTGCGACSDICPTGALIALQDVTIWELRFVVSLCNQCGLCQNVCSQNCISITSMVNLRSIAAGEVQSKAMRRSEHVQVLTEPIEDRMARLLGCAVTR